MLSDVVRHERGLDTLVRIGGPQAAAPITAMHDIAPDLVRFAIDFAYGEVLSRPGLDLKMRQLCTVAALSAMGTATPQLKWHIDGALNVGWEPSDLLDAMLLSAVNTGSVSIGRSLSTAREVFAARGAGADALAALDDASARWCEIPPVFESLELDQRTKAMISIAALTAVANAPARLKAHIRAALDAGASRDQVIEVIEQMAVYAGFPAALNGIAAARDVFEGR
jgi:4-carboxymuconolactone decarboxylase